MDLKVGDFIYYKDQKAEVMGICGEVIFVRDVEGDKKYPVQFFLYEDLMTYGWRKENNLIREENENTN